MGGQPHHEKKEILAYELTSLVHGEEEASKAKAASRAIFSGGDSENMPSTEVDGAMLSDGKNCRSRPHGAGWARTVRKRSKAP